MADEGNGMQRYDSEPLFGDEVYQLLRDDSLLHRTGSNNFAALIDSADSSHFPDDRQQQQQTISSQTVSGTPGHIFATRPQSQEQRTPSQQPIAFHWDSVGDNDDIPIPSSLGLIAQQEPLVSLLESSSSSYILPDTTPSRPVPSLQPWPGRFLFSLFVPTDNKDRNKWCYSQSQQKLYVCPNVAVPVNLSLGEWVDATLTITPVFKQSNFRLEPVTRCYNCKSSQGGDPTVAEHIIQLEGEGCEYKCINERYVVTVPLQPPPPGEDVSTLFIKMMCLTSCVGGPNRRPFNIVFTLRSTITGLEVGRQVLDVKCCKCPSRDMANEDKCQSGRVGIGMSTLDDEKRVKVRKLASEIVVGQKRKRPTIKLEPGEAMRTVKIDCPGEFEEEVKKYINSLVSAKLVKQSQPGLLPYPDVI